jgi:hypothetical protein
LLRLIEAGKAAKMDPQDRIKRRLRIKADRAMQVAAGLSDEKSAASLRKLAADYLEKAEAIER